MAGRWKALTQTRFAALIDKRMTKLYLELAKARLSLLVLLTTLVGAVLGRSSGFLDNWTLLWTLLGTALAAAGANALNQWLERELDTRMERTRNRPLPAGKMSPRHALLFGMGSAVAGVAVLASLVNTLAAALALSVILFYTLVYTPLKRRSTFCTLAGAVCGAIPPMIGWAASTGRLDTGAWLLGAVLFVWQIPHFFSLAWLYRHDYARGGFRMLPVVDRAGDLTCRALLMFAMVLVPLGLTVTLTGMAGPLFALGSILLGMGWLVLGVRLYRDRSDANARKMFLGSLVYLPLLLGLMVADRGPADGEMLLAADGNDPAPVTTAAMPPTTAFEGDS
jgi:protoheme IX farnesyltransferase